MENNPPNTLNPIVAIDPGPLKSALVIYDRISREILNHLYEPNQLIRNHISNMLQADKLLVIEGIEGYGIVVGASIFATCRWTGIFEASWSGHVLLLGRKAIKSHLCGTTTAKDAHVREALLDKFGPPGTKKTPGPTYGITGDKWAALAVAVTAAESS